LAASGRTYFREPFISLLADAVHIPPPYCLRCSYGLTLPDCGLRCALALEETILNLGAETVSAFIAEPVSGATLAVCPPPPGYLKLIREICDRYGVMLIFDEVMTGMGRTGRWFASHHWDVVPDLMTLGKGLSSGALPLSAVAAKSEHVEVIARGSGNFVHGGTFSHHPVAAAAALAVVDIIEREDLVERSDEMGRYLGERLQQVLSSSPYVLDIRGIGLMWGMELGQEKTDLTPFPRNQRVAERLREALFRRGFLLYPAMGMAGKDGDGIIFGPPFIVERSQINATIDSLADLLPEVIGG
jgi:adenosylmethionine-8-amino-7-oxononanoate aminotransferase